MPYKAKNGADVPDFCSSFMKPGAGGQYCHGDLTNCCCFCITCTPCSIDFNICAKLCAPCQGLCKPVCGGLLKCEETCQAKCEPLCKAGPTCPCKTAGVELTCGVPALEKIFGVWHMATDKCPGQVPSVLYPCCCLGCPLPGQDETNSGGNFAKGGPTVDEIAIVQCLCSPMLQHPCLAPHTACSMGSGGFCMDPLFNGKTPFWFCNENRCCSISMKKNGAVSP